MSRMQHLNNYLGLASNLPKQKPKFLADSKKRAVIGRTQESHKENDEENKISIIIPSILTKIESRINKGDNVRV
jgi:hypothetical protein